MERTALPFRKYQGLGNDFVLIDLGEVDVREPPALSRLLCDRHRGIGADGLILVAPHATAAARMEFYNPDGSRAQMCGNGVRCLARYLRDAGLETAASFSIMTDAGVREASFVPDGVRATLGTPSFAPDAIPTLLDRDAVLHASIPLRDVPDLPPATCLSLGNPHCVFWVEDVRAFPVATVGPLVERHPLFPERINVEFAELMGASRIVCRVWERGAGETPACGTGAGAVLVAATLRGFVPGEAVVELPGGELAVAWRDRGVVTIAGRAEEVFRGSIEVPAAFAARSLRAAAPAPLVA